MSRVFSQVARRVIQSFFKGNQGLIPTDSLAQLVRDRMQTSSNDMISTMPDSTLRVSFSKMYSGAQDFGLRTGCCREWDRCTKVLEAEPFFLPQMLRVEKGEVFFAAYFKSALHKVGSGSLKQSGATRRSSTLHLLHAG